MGPLNRRLQSALQQMFNMKQRQGDKNRTTIRQGRESSFH